MADTGYPRILIINLAASVDRREQMARHLAELGLVGEFFPAIDGRKMSDEEIAAVYDAARARTTKWGELTRGEIGCALSHRSLWQALVDSGDCGWLILEDDALLAPDVPQWLARLPEVIADGEVVPFVYTTPTPFRFRQFSLGKRRIVYPNQSFYAATAYFITRGAAQRLLKASSPLWFPIDCWYCTPGFKGVTPIRAIWPEAVVPRDKSLEASTIGARDAHAGKPEICKSWLRGRLSAIRRYLKNSYFVRPIRFD